MTRPPEPTRTSSAGRPRLTHLAARLLRRPQVLVSVWNWKSALFSIALRGPIFFTAALSHGLGAALAALFAEALFCAAGVGLYNALVQTLRDGEPLWLTGIVLSVIFPGALQAVEYTVHRLRGTPHLRTAAIVSLCASATGTLFNWYAMRHGAMLVGRESASLFADVARLPRLVLGFVTLPARWLWRKLTGPSGMTPAQTSAPAHSNNVPS